jgi:hypothetical protein
MKTMLRPMPMNSAPVAPAPAWPLAPLLAGARARGFADAFEWLGLAAILLDEHGEVLHLGAGAVELMKDELFSDGGRLRAREKLTDVRLRIAISSALRDLEAEDLVLPSSDGGAGLALRVAPIGDGLADEAMQLLRVVVVLERVEAPLDRRN